MTSTKLVRGALRQVTPKGPTLQFGFNPASVVDSPAVGGWQEVPRPYQHTALEWVGLPLRTLSFTLVFDGFAEGRSVEPKLAALEAMGQPAGPGLRPPRLQLLYGPAAAPGSRWVINELTYGDEIRNAALERIRVEAALVLARYRSPGVADLTPAETAGGGNGGTSGGGSGGGSAPPHKPPLFRVAALAGDTLARIAARELGDASRWGELADLNGIRDPRALTAGQLVAVPRS